MTSPDPKEGVSHKSVSKDVLPGFFDFIDADAMQYHLIRNDASGKLSHLIAVPMHRLSRYVNDPTIDSSEYLWELESMNCARLRRICSRLGVTQSSFRNGTGSTQCLAAILRQPGNRKFHWDQYRKGTAASKSTETSIATASTVDPVLSSPSSLTPASIQRKQCAKPQKRRTAPKKSSARVQVPTPARGKARSKPCQIPIRSNEDCADTPMHDDTPAVTMNRLNWDTYALILEGHRRSIEQKRNQEFAYFRALNTGMIHDEVRRRMLRTVETIQASIQVEEEALTRLQAQYHDCVIRIAMSPTGAGTPVTPTVPNYKTSGLKDVE